jgi:hypothetical protein
LRLDCRRSQHRISRPRSGNRSTREHEPVELGLRQRIRALHLDGILGSEDEERLVERVPHPGGRHVVLLHRFEHGRLPLGRRAVDLIRENHIR